MRTRTRQKRQVFYRVELRMARVDNWTTREIIFFPSSVRPISTSFCIAYPQLVSPAGTPRRFLNFLAIV
jgi:hypothetical protein